MNFLELLGSDGFPEPFLQWLCTLPAQLHQHEGLPLVREEPHAGLPALPHCLHLQPSGRLRFLLTWVGATNPSEGDGPVLAVLPSVSSQLQQVAAQGLMDMASTMEKLGKP